MLFVLIGTAKHFVGPGVVAQSALIPSCLPHNASAAVVDLGQANLVQMAWEEPARLVQMKQGFGVQVLVEIAVG